LRYVEKVKREIKEHMTKFGMRDSAVDTGGEAGPSSNVSDIIGLSQDLFGDPNGAGPSCERGSAGNRRGGPGPSPKLSERKA
jgi:hypothetical protein